MFTVLGFSCILTEHLSIKAVLYIKPMCHEAPEKNYFFKRNPTDKNFLEKTIKLFFSKEEYLFES